jgi:hypothetical protein
MKQLFRALSFMLAVAFPFLLLTPHPAAASNCACLDGNGDDACGDPTDTPVADNDWLKGPGVGLGGNFAGSTFVVPAGCSYVVTTAPSGGIVVRADRIVLRGSIVSTPAGGEGILFIATGDILVDQVDAAAARPRLESGGANKLSPTVLANAAIAKSSVGLKAGGTCNIGNADLRGNPLTGAGQVGIQCAGDIDIHGSTVLAAGVDIQSLTGAIDAAATAGAVPPIGIECDDPAKNLAGNGNNNGMLDAGDFPCQLAFNNQADVINVCVPEPAVLPNEIRALNNPLVMIAATDLRLDSPTAPGNLLEGRFLINLVAEDGKVDADNAIITNHASGAPLGGARIFVFADPDTVVRVPVLKEKSTSAAPAGNIEIEGACFTSANDVRIGAGSVLVGTPAAAPCAQLADFIPVASGP